MINGLLRKVPAWPGYILLLIPSALLWQAALANQLGADPVKALEHEHGEIALQLLIASLMITPLRQFVGLNLIKFRRMLGLMAFAYAAIHFGIYLWLDLQFLWAQILGDLIKRPYIIVGWLAFVAMIPLAITSNQASIRRVGAADWRKLHRLVYISAIFVVLHYLWLVKSWTAEPLTYSAITLILLGLRLVPRNRSVRRSEVS